MRTILLLFVFIPGISFFGAVPALAQDSLTINRISTLEKKMEGLENRIAKLEHHVPAPSGMALNASSGISPVTVVLLDKRLKKANRFSGDTVDKISFTLQVSNNTQKDIRGFWGDVLIKDKSNKVIAAFVLKYDKFLRAGDATTWTGDIDYNKKFEGHVELLQAEKKDLSIELKPKGVNYSDGSSEVFGVKK